MATSLLEYLTQPNPVVDNSLQARNLQSIYPLLINHLLNILLKKKLLGCAGYQSGLGGSTEQDVALWVSYATEFRSGVVMEVIITYDGHAKEVLNGYEPNPKKRKMKRKRKTTTVMKMSLAGIFLRHLVSIGGIKTITSLVFHLFVSLF
ncbi:hypothetical protein H112_05880 [Trichophyton rubrum D6]|uniref:Uncharacterized protein n=2 Tax=Trichophyton rubrum TaxID=5551 RepID=A0A080WSW3_TRIRC|nr:uncharacterized protein TERG_12019 [Trichophyton rubrum CBS 118892]EZF16046.1 hypothetical protein H100_05895 [Trichophyton rubrum MR850]EZF40177.1 hypothetical protein H102_05864 [Trichophyton rubrum CBS 100081]EZF50810.1 hypothetical protein H103_05891 [Trichophyton rubrum CBS 288.86]EZF61403.1 hypothetical protein H104_05877 [Trichophyton rubrum CBS 289.86]EZF82722.1 hypothetical protein H110_05886 [Trichophyton rubrum MR1448]EZF93416.1 hypothetical protein H113_05931 [Trichophyton rubr